MDKPYNVYGVYRTMVFGPAIQLSADEGWQSSGKYPYKSILGGDGMQVAVDTRTILLAMQVSSLAIITNYPGPMKISMSYPTQA
jgi:hypothetical protein